MHTLIRHIIVSLCLFSFVAGNPLAIRADGVSLVRDIGTTAVGLDPQEITAVGSIYYFRGQISSSQSGLWKSDGTTLGTVQVSDVRPYNLIAFNGKLYFEGCSDLDGCALWRSDGTTLGTVQLSAVRPYDLIAVNGKLYFRGCNDLEGCELWTSDGTTQGTTLVKDIEPGSESSSPSSLTQVGSLIFFQANTSSTGYELWKSNGTGAGTVLVKDLEVGPQSSYPTNLANANGKLIFAAQTTINGSEPFISDGSAAGTILLKEIEPAEEGSFPREFLSIGANVFFIASNGLWRSDGTAAGTFQLNAAQVTNPKNLTPNGTLLYFSTGYNPMGFWRSDGTNAGTTLVKAINNEILSIAIAGSSIFLLEEDADNPDPYDSPLIRLWKSNGTTMGTTVVSDVGYQNDYGINGCFSPLYSIGSQVVFVSKSLTNGCELWHSDGTAIGTGLLADINIGLGGSSPGPVTVINSTELILSASSGLDGVGLWKARVSPLGASLISNFSYGTIGSNPYPILAGAGHLLFRTNSDPGSPSPFGYEYWMTNGESAETFKLSNVDSVSFGGVAPDTVGEPFIFAATNSMGTEPWRSDGTSSGTWILKDIVPGLGSSIPNGFVSAGPITYFSATSPAGDEIWASDGTTSGTVAVTPPTFSNNYDISYHPKGALGNNLLFSCRNYTAQSLELWRAGPTAGSASKILTLNDDTSIGVPSGGWGFSYAFGFEPLGSGSIFMVKNYVEDAFGDSTTTAELWRTDGTLLGTQLLAPILGEGNRIEQLGNRVIVFSSDPTTRRSFIYASDGTPAGTLQIADIISENGVYSGLGFDDYEIMAVPRAKIGGLLYFLAIDGSHGRELWRTNGTVAGTFMLKDINPTLGAATVEEQSSFQHFREESLNFATINGRVYFIAFDGAETAVWQSDGSSAGTFKVFGDNSLLANAFLRKLISYNGMLYFVGSDSIHGTELWRSDGTLAGTSIFADINPGGGSSFPHMLIDAGDRLFFNAFDGYHGTELWRAQADLVDNCPNDPGKLSPGICGCGVSDLDSDLDGTLNCQDSCALNPSKTDPGICGCAISDIDANSNGTIDCIESASPTPTPTPDLIAPVKERIAKAIGLVSLAKKNLKSGTSAKDKKFNASIKTARKDLTALIKELNTMISALPTSLTTSNLSVTALGKAQKALKKATGKKTSAKDAKKAWGELSGTLKKML